MRTGYENAFVQVGAAFAHGGTNTTNVHNTKRRLRVIKIIVRVSGRNTDLSPESKCASAGVERRGRNPAKAAEVGHGLCVSGDTRGISLIDLLPKGHRQRWNGPVEGNYVDDLSEILDKKKNGTFFTG